MAISISPEEQVRLLGILSEIEDVEGNASAAARRTLIPYSTWQGLKAGATPSVHHLWGFSRGLAVTPEQVVARIRGVEIPSGKRAKPLTDQVADAPLYVQIECFEVLSELLIKRLEAKVP